jgi:hypothetical protein
MQGATRHEAAIKNMHRLRALPHFALRAFDCGDRSVTKATFVTRLQLGRLPG